MAFPRLAAAAQVYIPGETQTLRGHAFVHLTHTHTHTHTVLPTYIMHGALLLRLQPKSAREPRGERGSQISRAAARTGSNSAMLRSFFPAEALFLRCF